MRLFNPFLDETLEVTWEETGGVYEMEAVRKYGLYVIGTRDYTYGYLLKSGQLVEEGGHLLVVLDDVRNYPTYKFGEFSFVGEVEDGEEVKPKVEEKKESSFWDSPFFKR